MSKQKYTVTELTNNIKYILEGNPSFKGFVLRGEISNFTKHYSGHLYFSLKDENSQIRAIMFKSYAEKTTFIPKEGMKVEVVGSLSLYGPQGTYSVQVTSMKEEGQGELHQKYLELKNNLKELGWFDITPKPIPKFPKRIGVVTSATGAVIQDITNTVNRRYQLTEIVLYSSAVQGTGASSIIAKQIKRANDEKLVDVLIVGRGGGSIEDLWAFNEIETIEAIYSSKIPVITAIGHETDTTISDFVADLRAPTPTAAAELATPNQSDLISDIIRSGQVIKRNFNNLITKHQANLIHLIERLEQSSPQNKILNYQERITNLKRLLFYYFNNKITKVKSEVNENILKLNNLNPNVKLKQNFDKINILKEKLARLYNYRLESSKQHLTNLTQRIKSPEQLIKLEVNNLNRLSLNLLANYKNTFNNKLQKYNYIVKVLDKINPLAIMQRGFAIVKDDNNKIIATVDDINIGKELKVELIDGIITTKVINKKVKE